LRPSAVRSGGEVPTDYVFERLGANLMPEKVKLSELFGDHPSILLYSFMYGPERENPCTGCTHLLDGLDGGARHAQQRLPIYVVAKSPIARLVALAKLRRWDSLIMLSTAGNTYDADYHGDTSKLSPEMRAERGYEDGKDWDEPIFRAVSANAESGGQKAAERTVAASARLSAASPPASRPQSAPTISPQPGTIPLNLKPL
jgi:uncharacterized protein DUF899